MKLTKGRVYVKMLKLILTPSVCEVYYAEVSLF